MLENSSEETAYHKLLILYILYKITLFLFFFSKKKN